MLENVLICGTNWLGDSIMSIPAVQMFKHNHPSCKITILTKAGLNALWEMCPAVDVVLSFRGGIAETFKAAGMVKGCGFDGSFIFPNSFRSAFIPFLAGVPVRTGVAGHHRRLMLTDVVRLTGDSERRHQSWEYLEIMNLAHDCKEISAPRLFISEDQRVKARDMSGPMSPEHWIGFMPGAAYGPAKRWPAEYFIEVGRSLLRKTDCGIVIMGTTGESDLCMKVRDGIGERAVSLAGRTSLPELAALLAICTAVVTNDSGGMHLATAVGTPVVAIFGITDPVRTGPLGREARIISEDGVERSRDIQRVSVQAEACLRAIKPERVFSAVLEFIGRE